MNSIQLASLLSGNASITPLLSSMFGMWALGVVTYLCRSLPTKLWRTFLARFTVAVEINNVTVANQAAMQSFFNWFMETKYAKHGRRFSFDGASGDRFGGPKMKTEDVVDRGVLGPGTGFHFFFFEKRPAWFSINKKSTDSREVTVYFFGTDSNIITRFITGLKPPKKDNEIQVYGLSGRARFAGEWEIIRTKKKRNIRSVILRHDIKDPIIAEIEEFYQSKAWYDDRGLIYKRTYIFHGIPGTGKSSLIYALASYFDRPVYMVNLNVMTEDTLQSAMDNIPPGAFVAIEDIDVGTAVAEREVPTTDEEKEKVKAQKISMSTILNMLDGIAAISGCVITITTNAIEKLDHAMTRKGRIDKIVEIPPLRDVDIREYISVMYPDNVIPEGVVFAEMPGCDVQGIFLDHKHDFDGFIEEMPKNDTAWSEWKSAFKSFFPDTETK